MADQKQTLVEEGTSFKGTMTSTCPVVVRGRLEGDIETPALTVTASGAVHGRAKVGSLSSEGEVSGELDAETIELSGKVCDNTIIKARTLEVRLSAESGKKQVFFGNCELNVGEPRNPEQSARAASSDDSE